MRRQIPVVMLLVLGLMLVLGAGLYAQVKTDVQTGLDRLEGYVGDLDKAKSTLTLKQKGTTSKFWKVVYNDKTAITKRNQPAKIEDLKNEFHVIVLGKFQKDKDIFDASRIDIRSGTE